MSKRKSNQDIGEAELFMPTLINCSRLEINRFLRPVTLYLPSCDQKQKLVMVNASFVHGLLLLRAVHSCMLLLLNDIAPGGWPAI